MNPTSAASPSSTQDPHAPLMAPNRPFAPSRRADSFPRSITQEELGYDPSDMLLRSPTLSLSDSQRGARTEGSTAQRQHSPPFELDSPRQKAETAPLRLPRPDAGALLPARNRDGVPVQDRRAPSPLKDVQWGSQNAGLRADVDKARTSIEALKTNMVEVQQYLQATSGRNHQLTTHLLQVEQQLVTAHAHRDTLQAQVRQLQSRDAVWVATLAQAVENTQDVIYKQDEAAQQSQQIHRRVQTATEETERLKACYDDLAQCFVTAEAQRFEALGPLPDHYRRIDTSNGPVALHKSTCLLLRPYVDFSEGPNATSTGAGRTCVAITKELLGTIAAWKNGLYIGEDVIGHGALYAMYRFALVHRKDDLRCAVEQELQRTALAAGHRILDHYERSTQAEACWNQLVRAVSAALPLMKPDAEGEGSIVRVNLGRCPHAAARSGPLYGDGDRLPDWRADIAMAHQALAAYCRSFHVFCSANTQLQIQEGTREMMLSWSCKLLG